VPLCSGIAVAAVAADSGIRVEQAWARRAVMLMGGGSGAVYATVVNGGSRSDALLGASSDAARSVEIHQSYQEAGVSKMRRVERIEVESGKSIELKPGGYHIMLIDLTRELKPDQVVDLMLEFQHAGKLAVQARIK
jgi:copper(I)-binding protein